AMRTGLDLHALLHGEERRQFIWRDAESRQRASCAGVLITLVAGNAELPRQRRQMSAEAFQQCALAAGIGPEQCHPASAVAGEIDVLQDGPAGVADAQCIQLQQRFAHGTGPPRCSGMGQNRKAAASATTPTTTYRQVQNTMRCPGTALSRSQPRVMDCTR